MPKRPIIPIILFALWCLLVCYLPSSVYWRDSGEFIISAFFLDIAHPAGFPLYSQISNLFALLPIGPIAFRVSAFSAFALLLAFVFVSIVINTVTTRDEDTESWQGLLALLPIPILLGAPVLIRQAVTAEVYVLNAAIIILLLILFIAYQDKRDLRFIYSAAFLSGLGLGNHVSLLLSIAPVVLIVFILERARLKTIFFPCLLLGLFGLSVYNYLPIRSLQNPVLNTGGASTPKRLVRFMTNQRDSLKNASTEKSTNISSQKSLNVEALLEKDVEKIESEIPLVYLILSLFGLIILAWKNVYLMLVTACAAIGNWVFFLGWDSDPWLPLLLIISIGTTIGLYSLIRYVGNYKYTVVSSIFIILTAVAFSRVPLTQYSLLRDFSLPAKTAKSKLAGLNYNSTLLTEGDWFLISYLQNVEGYRRDIFTAYQPSLLFPEYFNPIEVTDINDNSWTAANYERNSSGDFIVQNSESISSFIKYAAERTPFFFIPNAAINDYLHEVTSFNANGSIELRHGKIGFYEDSFLDSAKSNLIILSEFIKKDFDTVIAADTRHHFELSITELADLLEKSEHREKAISLLSYYCGSDGTLNCSKIPINNLAVLYLREGAYNSAGLLLLKLYKERTSDIKIRENLKLTLKHLSSEMRQQICTQVKACDLMKELEV